MNYWIYYLSILMSFWLGIWYSNWKRTRYKWKCSQCTSRGKFYRVSSDSPMGVEILRSSHLKASHSELDWDEDD